MKCEVERSALKGPVSSSGLVVLGTETGCGKTVVLSGVAGILAEEGFTVRALKPISMSSKFDSALERSFIAKVTASGGDYPVQYPSGPGCLTQAGWDEAMAQLAKAADVTLVELPGSAATLLTGFTGYGEGFRDNAHFASTLKWPCLLVSSSRADALEKLLVNSFYLSLHNASLIGLVTVETAGEGLETLTESALYFQDQIGVPYLGNIPYSRSISVRDVNQGNLIKLTSGAIDMLPILKALNLPVAV